MKTPLALLAASLLFLWTVPASPAPSANGLTEPLLDVKLSLAVPGIVKAKRFKEGDLVQLGDVILELDKQLEELEVTRRRAVMQNRKTDRDATTILAKTSKVVSQEELEKRELEFQVASADYATAVEQLQRRQLLSPLSGAITEIHLEAGEACQPYQPIVRVVDVRRCYFVTHIEAQEAAPLKLDQPVKLELETGSTPVKVDGKIVFLSPVADPASGLIRIKVLFENPDAKIRPGLAGKILFN